MTRFAAMLQTGLAGAGIRVELLNPEAILGRRFSNTASGLGKWVAYLDKFCLFPIRLRFRLSTLNARFKNEVILHICDHSNAMYGAVVPDQPLAITCHDLGAVRGALGEATDCPSSTMGRLLQRWIRTSLGKADVIACDSEATRVDVLRLVRRPNGSTPAATTVLLGQNAPYRTLEQRTYLDRLADVPGLNVEAPFLLNVGSNLSRKNRDGALRVFAKTKDHWSGNFVFSGQPLAESSRQLAQSLGVADRVMEVPKASHEILEALYNRAFALLFLSKFEGFGWPVIEAQACGCPVLCSDAGSLAEVAGASAFVRPWQAEDEFAEEILRLAQQPQARLEWQRRGYENVKRFDTSRMISDYVTLYKQLTRRQPSEELR